MESTLDLPEDRVDPMVVRELQRSRPWILFSAFALYGLVGFMAIGVLVSFLGDHEAAPLLRVGMIFLMAVLYGSPAFLMHRYAQAIKKLCLDPTSANLVAALNRSAFFWRLVGLMTFCCVFLALAMAVGSLFA